MCIRDRARCASNGRVWQAQLSQGVDEAWTCWCRDVEVALAQAGVVSPEGGERSRGTRGAVVPRQEKAAVPTQCLEERELL
eukprot:15206738-Alexandrium_andersonii.AAC.1